MKPMKTNLPGSAIRRRRKEKGLTLRDLAEQSGVAFQTISEVERGMRPTKKAAFKLAIALEFSPLEWTWYIPGIVDNLHDLGANNDEIDAFLHQLEVDEWIDLERW